MQNLTSIQQIRNYVDHLGTLHTHIKSYRAAFHGYKIAPFTILSAGYVTSRFLLPSLLATIVSEVASNEMLRGTKLSPAIRAGHDTIDYEIKLGLNVSRLSWGISVVLGIPMNSKKLTFSRLPPSLSQTMTVTLLLYITSPTPFSLSPLTINV